jgi:DNA-binding IclR family transcriptional regulator
MNTQIQKDILHAIRTGDEAPLRSTAEGRAILLECAHRHRKQLRYTRRAAESARKTIDDIVVGVLKGTK